MFVVGTAGHVDHGKSTLVEALTGTHPDRLREERERGLTIELGFGWCTLPSGREVSVVDVPGHVRFVRHMLAGIGAVDVALLVIAADEGLMPQTREHLEILDLLGVGRGVVALTKCDLPDADWLALVEEEVRSALAETPLAEAPLVRVSAQSGEGLDELRTQLDRVLDHCPPPRDIGHPRVGIDRVFTMQGFGTVVTGTLLDGALHIGDALQAVPGGPTGRVRGLHTHGRPVEVAAPGTRVAVNLAGVSQQELHRGQVLGEPDRLAPVHAIDVRLRALPDRALRHNLRVTVHAGVGEVQGRLRVLGQSADTDTSTPGTDDDGRGAAIASGTEGWTQIVLSEPIAVLPGDRCVVRVSDRTVGGGTIVDINPPRHRPGDPDLPERLARLASGTPESHVLAALERLEPATAEELLAAVAAGGELDAEGARAALRTLAGRGEALSDDSGADAAGPIDRAAPIYLSRGGRGRLVRQAATALTAFHREYPLRLGMPEGQLGARLALPAERYAAVLPLLAPEVRRRGRRLLALADWEPRPTAAQRQAIEALAAQLHAAAMQPPRLGDVDPELVRHLVDAGRAVDCGDGVVLDAAAFDQARERLTQLLLAPDAAALPLSAVRDALGSSRRVAQAIAEHLDALGVTERRGDARVAGPALRGATP